MMSIGCKFGTIHKHVESTEFMNHIFISYSRTDIDFARYLHAMLENNGFDVWMDEKRISASMSWTDEIQKAIDDCGAFIVIMSPDAKESNFVQSEVLHALDHKKPMFPVLFAGEPFFILKAYQYEDMRGGLGDKFSEQFFENLQSATGTTFASGKTIRFEVVENDVMDIECDVLVLKYAMNFYGADWVVAKALHADNIRIDEHILSSGQHILQKTGDLLAPQYVLFVPTVNAYQFSYSAIRNFTENAFTILATEEIDMKHVAMTIHGIGFGLDEQESLMAQVGGALDVLQSNKLKLDVEHISIVDHSPIRADRLKDIITLFFRKVPYGKQVGNGVFDLTFEQETQVKPPEAGQQNDEKPYMLAILPEEENLEDIFYYGIQRPAHAMGLLCERIQHIELNDETEYEMLSSELERIRKAKVLVCDVTQITPMVYLKLGYAWGCSVPTALITQSGEYDFDERHYIKYQKIWELEEGMSLWLKETLGSD